MINNDMIARELPERVHAAKAAAQRSTKNATMKKADRFSLAVSGPVIGGLLG